MGGLDGQGRGGSCRWWGADRRAGAVGGAGVRLPITGYDIIDADSLEAAKALCDGHPFVAGALADFSVDVYELTPSRRCKAARAACARGSSDWFGTHAVRVTE